VHRWSGLQGIVLLAATSVAAEEAQLEPGSPEAVEAAMRLFDEARALSGEDRVVEAMAVARRAFSLAPGAPGPRRLLGELHFQDGDCALAMHQLAAFVRLGRVQEQVAEAGRLLEECRSEKSHRGRLLVRVVPEQAAVRVRSPASKTPVAEGRGQLDVGLPSGSYRIEARLAGYQRVSARVRVPAGGVVTVSHSLSRAVAALEVTTLPTGAQVTVDGRPVGTAPVELAPLAEGSHEVLAELPGFRAARAKVVARAGHREHLGLRLQAEPVRVRVVTNAEEAVVQVDGRPRCRPPCEVALAPGRPQRLRVRAPGYLSGDKELLPRPGQFSEVRIPLRVDPAAGRLRVRRQLGMGVTATGAALAAAGVWALLSALGTADAADAAYGRYEGAGTSREARAAWDEAAALDGRARIETAVSVGLLAVGVGVGAFGGWRWLAPPPDEDGDSGSGGD